MNDSDVAVGFSRVAATQIGSPFLWTAGGGMVNLGHLPGSLRDSGLSINNAGQVVGGHPDGLAPGEHAWIWTQANGMQDIGVVGDDIASLAWGINASGMIVGQSIGSGGPHIAIWSSPTGTAQSIGTGGHTASMAPGQSSGTGRRQAMKGSIGRSPVAWLPSQGLAPIR